MTHENDSLDTGERRGAGHAGALPQTGHLSRSGADAAPGGHQPPSNDGARSAFEVGQPFMAASNGEKIELTQISADFIHWINPKTGSTGRMMRRYFSNFFTPVLR